MYDGTHLTQVKASYVKAFYTRTHVNRTVHVC